LDTVQTTERVEALMGGLGKVACIGLAGENLVKYAAIMNDKYRAAGRAGMGTVMGWKNLKAIGVRGTGALEVADFDGLKELAADARRRYTTGKWGTASQESLGQLGTTGLIEAEQEIGRFPTKNHWSGVYEDYEMIGSRAIQKHHRKKRKSCMGCNIHCKYVSMVDEGKDAGAFSDGPEYETVMAFGSNCLNNDLPSIIHANMLCNLYGMDTISAGKTISFAMECHENGLIDEKIEWGDSDKIIELVHQIAKREGIGDMLAEGSREAAKRVGGNAADYAIHVKGLELSGQDGRPHKSVGLTHAISVRGADHLRSLSSLDELGYVDIVEERYPDRVEEVMSLRNEVGKGSLVCDMEDLYSIVDSLLICKYGTMWPPIYYFNDFIKIIPVLTGFSEFADEGYTRDVARRICLLRRAFNAREGITRKDDQLPKRDLQEPMPEGPAKGQVVDLDTMLDEFYEFRGCHPNGVPKAEALCKVGLDDVAKELEARNITGIGGDD
jgi:aldehyde:ferredoxin oxidoreductase